MRASKSGTRATASRTRIPSSLRRALLLLTPVLALAACGGGGDPSAVDGRATDSKGSRVSEGTPQMATPTAGSGDTTVGVRSVENTPVATMPQHEGHERIGAGAPDAAPPTGPEFPVTEVARTWVVSPSGDDAADGSEAAPFKTISHAITQAGPGDVIRVLSGTYAEKIDLGDQVRAGEPGRPIILQGEGSPKLVPTQDGKLGLIDVKRPWWIIDGFVLDLQGQRRFAVTFQGNVEGSTLANSELFGGTLGGAVTTFANADGARIENNHIHDFTQGSVDSHGVVIQPTSRNVVIRHNDIHDTSGDSVQCLGPEGFSNDPPARGVIIEGNHFFNTRENAADIKTCYDVQIRYNRMHGFTATDSAKGDAVVVHYSASNVLVEENDIYDAGTGIAVGGNREGAMPSGIVVRRNRIRDIHANGGAFGHGIRVENAQAPVISHNTVTNTAGPALVIGQGTGGPTQDASVTNNLFDSAKGVRLGGQAPGLETQANLFRTGATFEHNPGVDVIVTDFAGWNANHFPGSLEGAPLLGDGFSPGAPAIDRGTDVGEASCGSAPDIGAVETGC